MIIGYQVGLYKVSASLCYMVSGSTTKKKPRYKCEWAQRIIDHRQPKAAPNSTLHVASVSQGSGCG